MYLSDEIEVWHLDYADYPVRHKHTVWE